MAVRYPLHLEYLPAICNYLPAKTISLEILLRSLLTALVMWRELEYGAIEAAVGVCDPLAGVLQ